MIPQTPVIFDPEHPTQAQIDAVSETLNKAVDDPIASSSGYIMTKMLMRALKNATEGL